MRTIPIDRPIGYTTASALGVPPSLSGHAPRYQQVIDRELSRLLSALPLVVPILETLGLREIVAARNRPSRVAIVRVVWRCSVETEPTSWAVGDR